MKIVRNTPDELVLRSSLPLSIIWPAAICFVLIAAGILSLLNGDIIVGGGSILMTVFPGYFVWRDARLDFARLNRSEDVLEIRRLTLTGHERVRHPLGDLSHAFVDKLHLNNERRSRVVLVLDRGMDAGQHPLISHHVVGLRADIAAATLNGWRDRHVDSKERPT